MEETKTIRERLDDVILKPMDSLYGYLQLLQDGDDVTSIPGAACSKRDIVLSLVHHMDQQIQQALRAVENQLGRIYVERERKDYFLSNDMELKVTLEPKEGDYTGRV